MLSLTSVICLFALTACNPDGEQKTTVTEGKWKTALSYYTVDWNEQTYYPILSDNPRTNFSCKQTLGYSGDGETHSSEITVSIDYDKKASGMIFVNDGKPDSGYGWKDGDVYYDVSGGWRIDSETGNKIEYYTKRVINEQNFLIGCDSGIYSYAGGDHIYALKLADKYGQFTYSEETAEYSATIYYEFYETDAAVSVKFEDGKLVYMSVNISGGQYGNYVYSYEYTYGIMVTVPDYFLNLQIGENIRN